jgi:hypothetical protein
VASSFEVAVAKIRRYFNKICDDIYSILDKLLSKSIKKLQSSAARSVALVVLFRFYPFVQIYMYSLLKNSVLLRLHVIYGYDQ